MSAPTNPLLPNCDTEQESPEQDSSQEVPSRRGIFGYKLSNESPVNKAFKEAFDDLKRIGKKRKDGRPLDWSFIRRVLWASCWNLSVLGLLIYLCLVPLGVSDDENRCQPDGEFRFDGEDQLGGFDWWAPRGFFQITLGWGRFSFGTAKLIDVIWDLVVGRGGQTVMAFISWRVFVQYLQLSLLTKPASYSTVWFIKIQNENSALSTWRLASGFFRVGLASKKVMCFIIWTALFILAFPTFASSMTGYTPYNKAYVNSTTGKLVQFSEVAPVAYLIRDGDRVDGLSKDYPVLWRGNATDIAKPSSFYLFDECSVWNLNDTGVECRLQRDVSEYAQLYGFDGKGNRGTQNGQKTYFRNKTLNWPPLNIKAFYLPDNAFYWNWTEFTGKMSEKDLNPYGNRSALTFLVEDGLYNVKEVQAEGICQPIKSGESIVYQWGFSFLQFFVMTILLQSWSIGLFVLWTTTDLTLKRNNIAASSEGWKGLLELTDNIKEQIESAGIIWEDLTDKELHGQIQHLLTGGPVPTSSEESDPVNPLPQGHSSLWSWIRKVKWRLLKVMFFIACICLENTLRFDGFYYQLNVILHKQPGYRLEIGTLCMAVVLYTIASMLIAGALGSTYRQRLLITLGAIVLCVPFLFYAATERDFVLPGFSLGAILAFFLGSSRGSRAVLFLVPLLCNYVIVFGLFISSMGNPSSYYDYLYY